MTSQKNELANATILIVDDVPANLKTLSTMLKQCGYQVKPAQNGKAALKAAIAYPPDLVLLDIRMPEMDGYETCEKFKHEDTLKKIPIIFISALGETEDKIKAFESGGADYITKPFNAREVQARVRTHLSLAKTSRELELQNKILEQKICELKLAEENLRESEERYRSFFTSLEAIKLIINPVSGAIVDANQAAVDFYGYDLNLLKTLHIYDLRVTPKKEVLDELSEVKNMEVSHLIKEHRLASGKIREVEIYSSPIQYCGNSLVLSSIHDITEFRHLEQIKDDVERIIRHDLKSPLNCIINIPQILMTDENLTTSQKEMLGLIITSGSKMLNQINSSLEIHKIESGSYFFEAQECDLIEIIRSNISILSVSLDIDMNSVNLKMNEINNKNNSAIVQSDHILLDIILMNLLRNAFEASDKGTKVIVEISEAKENFVIVISNNRPVPLEIREKFFEKYVTFGKKLGTGLGTYSASIMARAIGGKISMETSDETGTKVTLSIPCLQT